MVPFVGPSPTNSLTLLRSYSGPVSLQATGIESGTPVVAWTTLFGQCGPAVRRPVGVAVEVVGAGVLASEIGGCDPSARTIISSALSTPVPLT